MGLMGGFYIVHIVLLSLFIVRVLALSCALRFVLQIKFKKR